VLPVALAGYDYRDQVRQGQLNVDQDSGQFCATDGARLVLTDDLPMNADNLHISAAGQIELGTRLADATGSVVVANAVDFNGDRRVDCADVCALIDHWYQDEPTCDIAPPPFGDGIVDVQDLIVVADHLFQEIMPVELIAYWKLDEAESSIAYDSIGQCDGTLNGDPQWQPANGKKDGALHFDGTDDYVSTPFILNPVGGAFSVFVWIKGGAPGQVILSQESGVNWLMANAVDGALKTNLRTPEKMGRSPIPKGPPLICPTVVTDGDWHRVGFVRDGSDRILYVDDMEVVRDTATNLESASGGLYIGTGSDLEPGAFWSGLIDDVRIYNPAVTP